MKKILGLLLAYCIIISNASLDVFANSINLADKFKFKEQFYAQSIFQYKDKTLVTGRENPEYGDQKTFIIDKNGNKTYLNKTLSFEVIEGNKAKTTYKTPLEIAASSDNCYEYDFETEEISIIEPDKDAYNKLKSDLENHFANKQINLNSAQVLNEDEYNKLKKTKNFEEGKVYLIINDLGQNNGWVSYNITIYDDNYSHYNGLYKDGKIYEMEDIKNSNNIRINGRFIEFDNKLYIIVNDKDLYEINGNDIKKIYSFNSSVYGVEIVNSKYIIVSGGKYGSIILKKNIDGLYNEVDISDLNYMNSNNFEFDSNDNLWLYNISKESTIYKEENETLVSKGVFSKKIFDLSVYNDEQMSVILEGEEESNTKIYANTTTNSNQQNGWVDQNGKWYYYENGEMLTGWQYIDNNWYYLDGSGEMLTGWQYINSNWYYLNESGEMLTGWQYINSNWYYLDESGAMLTGWQYIDNNWYYLNGSGAMLTGWQYIDNNWYYLYGSGAMLIGWQYIDNNWYYLYSSGVMSIGWQYIDNNWYYLNRSGVMLIGWQYIDNNWYYLYSSGSMATNVVIDGWKINASGVAKPM